MKRLRFTKSLSTGALTLWLCGCGGDPRDAPGTGSALDADHATTSSPAESPPGGTSSEHARPATNRFVEIDRTGSAWDSTSGVATQLGDALCLFTLDDAIPAGAALWLIRAAHPQAVYRTSVEGRDPVRCAFNGSEENQAAYLLQPVTPEPMPDLFIAVVAAAGSPVQQDSRVSIDIDGDGTGEVFRECTGSEGVHHSIWSGNFGSGERRWHSYYHLDYDVETTCTADDFPESPGTSPE